MIPRALTVFDEADNSGDGLLSMQEGKDQMGLCSKVRCLVALSRWSDLVTLKHLAYSN